MSKKKIWRRGIPFSPEVAPLVARMPAVDEYRESLLRLQGVWDTLSMLGQMSGTLPDIAATRSAFQALTETLLDSLGRCLLTNVTQHMRNQGQVAIDILVRNLFERTADIGFLSTDTAVREFMQADAPDDAQRHQLEARFADYAAKYSVYDDIVVLATDGRVLARLDGRIDAPRCNEPWLARALAGEPYVEHYGPSPTMGGRNALLYAAAIRSGSATLGVMCLSFRLADEMRSVFQQLLPAGDPAVIALVDAQGEVLASSDRWQLPLGATLPPADAAQAHQHLRFAGREYLSVSAAANAYEGYHGPGWSARVLVSIDQAFEPREDDEQASTTTGNVLARIDTREHFNEELRSIPPEALRIQRDLSRVLWNGKLQPVAAGASGAFAATLLREVGLTGERIRQVFDQATHQLHLSTLSAVFEQARHHARLAIDIMDRNLYERANDCRWWALDGVLRQVLAQPPEQRDASAAASVLARINGLYTVYSLLVLFDTQGQVVAVSDPAASQWRGQTLDAPWVRETLALRDSQSYTASAHAPSPFYGDRATYVFAAALRSPDAQARVVGGIAIVFDGEPQFEAMLADSLPQGHEAQPPGSVASLLVTRSGQVVSSSDARWPVGSAAPLPPGLPALARGEADTAVIDIDGTAYVAGYAMSGGYREYRSTTASSPDDVAGLMLLRLGKHQAAAAPAVPAFEAATPAGRHTASAMSIASFLCDGQWLGIPASAALQALQRPRLATIANAPTHVLGMTMFEGQLLPVIDLARLRTHRPTTDIDAPVVVAQGPGGQRFALRVDELGPVFEVPNGSMQAVQHGPHSGEHLVRGNKQMLTLLDVNKLIASSGAVRLTGDAIA
ncbi:MAG TPA: chemotaxis protein CheW [Rhizobacter sp.]|nr:chemotaxis protein CheW [Rhizobacter sp.]